MSLKPIETVYNNYRFRSRLEARWAYFFDQMQIRYEYEKEGYDIGQAGHYLPDFWLPEYKLFVEVKPNRVITENEKNKAIELVRQSGSQLLMVFDCDEKSKPELYYPTEPNQFNGNKNYGQTDFDLMACNSCNCLGGYSHDFNFVVELKEHCCGKVGNSWKMLSPIVDINDWDFNIHNGLKEALIKARQARFEFGQTPNPGR